MNFIYFVNQKRKTEIAFKMRNKKKS